MLAGVDEWYGNDLTIYMVTKTLYSMATENPCSVTVVRSIQAKLEYLMNVKLAQ